MVYYMMILGRKRRNQFILLLAGGGITLFFLLPIVSPFYRQLFLNLITTYPYTAPFIIIIFRFLGVVVAPLPGMPVAFASMTLLEWWKAGLYNFIGSASGGICAFLIARNYRERVVAYFVPLENVHAWQDTLSRKKQFLTLVAFRFLSVGAFDFVVYALGLTKISFKTYLATVLLVDLPMTTLFFYAGGVSLKYSIYLFAAFMALLFIFSSFILKSYTHK